MAEASRAAASAAGTLSAKLLPLALPLLVVAGHRIRGWGEFLTVAVIFALLPLLDLLSGDEEGNPDPASLEQLKADGRYTWAALAWLPLHYGLLAYAGYAVATAGLSWLELVGLTLSVGILTGGLGITIGHELGHRTDASSRWASTMLLWPVGYLHFQVEHNKGHHSRVGTDADPASAPRGQSLYAFLPQTLFRGIASAWRFEADALVARGRPAWHPSNRVILALAAWPLLAATGWALAGAQGLVLLVGQAAVAVLLLEAVNYVEHYGLRRVRLADGSYERFSRDHAWDSPRRLTNVLLYNLQRHSHHHQEVTRPWQTLEYDPDGPVLPASYPSMVIVALIPPLYRALIHPRLDEVEARRPA